MALSLYSSSSSMAAAYQPFSRLRKKNPANHNILVTNYFSLFNNSFLTTRSLSHRHNGVVVTTVCCEVKETAKKLQIGSPIIVIEAPKMLKTAASVPCLRANSGLVNPGDVGRIVSRKPKDVWAVRLSIGTYLIDRRYFKPLELDDERL